MIRVDVQPIETVKHYKAQKCEKCNRSKFSFFLGIYFSGITIEKISVMLKNDRASFNKVSNCGNAATHSQERTSEKFYENILFSGSLFEA